MRELHLFAGAGGGILGGMLLGHTPVCAVEIDAYCRSVLRARQSEGWLPAEMEIHDDVTTFDGTAWRGRVDVVAGGFPCQDISTAGRGAGLDGSKSGLFFQLVRVVREVRPRYVFLENSPAITLRGLGRVLAELAALGFDAEWTVLGAADAGAPHLRERWWCLARARADADLRFSDEPKATLQARRFAADGLRGATLHTHADGGPCESIRREMQPEQPMLSRRVAYGLRATGSTEVERLPDSLGTRLQGGVRPVADQKRLTGLAMANGSDKRQRSEPALGRAPDGLARWMDRSAAGYWPEAWDKGVSPLTNRKLYRNTRLHALGNGQVPQCAAAAFRILWERLHA